jgi:hypothetical protein
VPDVVPVIFQLSRTAPGWPLVSLNSVTVARFVPLEYQIGMSNSAKFAVLAGMNGKAGAKLANVEIFQPEGPYTVRPDPKLLYITLARALPVSTKNENATRATPALG